MECGCVQSNLFVGLGPSDEADFDQLRAMGITAILSLQTEEDVSSGGYKAVRKPRRSEAWFFATCQLLISTALNSGVGCGTASPRLTTSSKVAKSCTSIARQE
jgi:hypothetical protein